MHVRYEIDEHFFKKKTFCHVPPIAWFLSGRHLKAWPGKLLNGALPGKERKENFGVGSFVEIY